MYTKCIIIFVVSASTSIQFFFSGQHTSTNGKTQSLFGATPYSWKSKASKMKESNEREREKTNGQRHCTLWIAEWGEH
jgi:hypothetical protein